jgi:hypothetical protein
MDFAHSREQFSQLENLVVPNKERFELHRFPFRGLKETHTGRIKRLYYDYAMVEYAQGAVEIYASLRRVSRDFVRRLFPDALLFYVIEFNLKGPTATHLQLESS